MVKLGHYFIFGILFSLILSCGCAQKDLPKQISANEGSFLIVTEDFPPYNYLDSKGEVTGQSTEVIREIMKRTNQNAEISIMPLSDAYELAFRGPNVIIYSLGRTPQREEHFKWVGPIGSWKLTFYANKNPRGLILDFERASGEGKLTVAKNVGRICVVKDDVRHQFLTANGFSNIYPVMTDLECANRVAIGLDDLWFGSSTSFSKITSEAGLSSSIFEPVYAAGTNDLYIAFSKDVLDSTIANWQSALDAMKADGKFGTIEAKYSG